MCAAQRGKRKGFLPIERVSAVTPKFWIDEAYRVQCEAVRETGWVRVGPSKMT